VRMSHLLILFLLGVALVAPSTSMAQTSVPILEARVTDMTKTLTFTESKLLDTFLKKIEDSASVQIAVLFMPGISGIDANDYAADIYSVNLIGQEKRNRGVLIFYAKNEQEIAIVLGKGLGASVTDDIKAQIISQEMLPKFQDGAAYAGLLAGMHAIMAAVGGRYELEKADYTWLLITVGVLAFIAILIFAVIRPLLRTRRSTFIASVGHRNVRGWRPGMRPVPGGGSPASLGVRQKPGGATGTW
jgi:uncharacterized membrane protein YgcG